MGGYLGGSIGGDENLSMGQSGLLLVSQNLNDRPLTGNGSKILTENKNVFNTLTEYYTEELYSEVRTKETGTTFGLCVNLDTNPNLESQKEESSRGLGVENLITGNETPMKVGWKKKLDPLVLAGGSDADQNVMRRVTVPSPEVDGYCPTGLGQKPGLRESMGKKGSFQTNENLDGYNTEVLQDELKSSNKGALRITNMNSSVDYKNNIDIRPVTPQPPPKGTDGPNIRSSGNLNIAPRPDSGLPQKPIEDKVEKPAKGGGCLGWLCGRSGGKKSDGPSPPNSMKLMPINADKLASCEPVIKMSSTGGSG